MKKQARRVPQLHVKFLWLSEALHGSILASVDVLRTASMVWGLRHPNAPTPLSWEIIDPHGGAIHVPGVQCNAPPDDIGGHVLITIPALHVHNSPEIGRILEANGSALHMIERHARSGGSTAATYGGIAFLAKLGLLDGAKITVPWEHHSWFSRTYPRVDFSRDSSITIYKRMFMSAAPASQIELMLAVLGWLVDSDLAEASANLLNFRQDRQALIAEVTRSKSTQTTSDSPVYRAIQWLSTHIEEPYCLGTLAEAAATSKRTLLRHFHEVTGMSPLDHLHRLRVERAKILLEVTIHSVESISHACGYVNVASFRRLFRSETGISPNAYRSRFTLRAPRVHWKVEDLG